MIGRTLLHYRIEEKLGEGGMGVVYKARDAHLDRFVALKLLPTDKIADPARKLRFVKEAKAASALNHPNIVHVYDIAEYEGVQFIVMEFVKGKTLAELVGRRGLRLNETLRYAVQISDALAQAHAAGIVHRDLKPSNVMVAENGIVKVLDFGLAKLTERVHVDELASTVLMNRDKEAATEEGTILGSLPYLSPEQASGQAVDARSDIFSFGVLLYEMVTGVKAFQRPTRTATLSAILNEDPPAIGRDLERIPYELEKIVSRCLRKDRARRFQHMDDLKLALEDLKEDSETGKQGLVQAPMKRQSARGMVLAVAALALVGAGAAAWVYSRSTTTREEVFIANPLTSYPGSERSPSFSPDGNQLAFSWNGERQDNFDIYVRLLDGGTPLRLTTDAAVDDAPAWSPDGRQIAFLRRREGGGRAIMIVSPLGGPERKLSDVSSTLGLKLAWTPDSRFLAFSDQTSAAGPSSIFMISVADGQRRRLTSPAQTRDLMPAISPDGRTLAFVRITTTISGDLYVLSLNGNMPVGEPRQLTSTGRQIFGLAWTSDGRELVLSSRSTTGSIFVTGQVRSLLWRVPALGSAVGEPRLLAGVTEGAVSPVISRPVAGVAARLAYERQVIDTNIWSAELSESGRLQSGAAPLIVSTRLDISPHISPDGKRIAFGSDRSGNYEAYLCDSDGRNVAQLTSMGINARAPRWSPDGSKIVFDARGAGLADIYVIGVDGSRLMQLTSEASDDVRPSWSKDGRWIYFRSNRSGTDQIWKMPSGSGAPVQLTKNGGYDALESPDGKLVYFVKAQFLPGLWSVPVDGGEEASVLGSVSQSYWGVAQTKIFFLDLAAGPGQRSPKPIRSFDFRTRQTRDIATVQSPVVWDIPGFSVSSDGRRILWLQVDQADSDLMLIDKFH